MASAEAEFAASTALLWIAPTPKTTDKIKKANLYFFKIIPLFIQHCKSTMDYLNSIFLKFETLTFG
jgi:hypothetical protein